MTNSELIAYYTNLLILQYKKDKASAHITALIDLIMLFELLDSLENGFDIDNGVGTQLDIIGMYLGIDRIVTGIPFNRDYFGFMEYGENPLTAIYKGFIQYGDTPPDTQMLTYRTSQDVLKLNDEEFRKILKFRIIQCKTIYSLYEIDEALFKFFGEEVYVEDNEDMTITYWFDSGSTRLATILQSENLLPKPMGVEVTINFY